MRLIMAAFYLAIGVVHLGAPDAFLPIMPEWVPAPRAVVLASGACEIAGALALLNTRLRRADGIMLALYAVCVFPANIKHAFQGGGPRGAAILRVVSRPKAGDAAGAGVVGAVYSGMVTWPGREREPPHVQSSKISAKLKWPGNRACTVT